MMVEPRRALRPDPIAILALLQLAKAGVLLAVGAMQWVKPEAIQPYAEDLQKILWIAAHGRSLPVVFLPVFGLYLAAIGIGLWNLKRWARANLIATSGITVALWARRLMIAYLLHEAPFGSAEEQEAVFILLVLDALTFCYLSFDLRVETAFRKRTRKRFI